LQKPDQYQYPDRGGCCMPKKDFSFNRDAPLEKAKGETAKAHHALIDYWRMGGSRSYTGLIESYEQRSKSGEKAITTRYTTIQQWGKRYKWQERIAAQVDIQTRKELAEFEEERKEWRSRRRDMLNKFFNTVTQALHTVDLTEANLSHVTAAMKAVMAELRTEYNDNPALTIAGDRHNPISHVFNFSDLTDDELEKTLYASISSLGLDTPEDIEANETG